MFVVEIDSTNLNNRLLAPRTFHGEGEHADICLVNPSYRGVRLKKGQVVGMAESAKVVDSPNGVTVVRVVEVDKDSGINGIQQRLPEHLIDLWQRSSQGLTSSESEQLAELLYEYQDVFARDEFDLGHFTALTHKIETGNALPIKEKFRRTPAHFAEDEEGHLQKMLKAGIIEPSISEWAAAPVLIRKKDGSLRWCVDYRQLNAVTIKDVYPLPLAEECVDTLAGNRWFSKLDANSAYYQIYIEPKDKEKTAFLTKYGSFQFRKMPFGMCNSPSTYSRAINLVMQGLTWKHMLAFLDDMLILGSDFNEHMRNLRMVFTRLREYGLRLKAKKCELCQHKVEFLGRVVSEDGLEMGNSYADSIENWKKPKNIKGVERFLGFANYHRQFIKNYAKIAEPLHRVTGKRPFLWTGEQDQAFEQLKLALKSPPVLSLPTKKGTFILDCDASNKAIGAELSQVQNGQERTIAYGSMVLSSEQRNYCTTRKELLAVIRFIRMFRHYLLGRRFIVRTDHHSLTWLMNFKRPEGQLARWLEDLSQYNMVLEHRPGRKHVNADALSRSVEGQPCVEFRTHVYPVNLPCGGCKYCTRAYDNWKKFCEDVDDVVPLTAVDGLEDTILQEPQDGFLPGQTEGYKTKPESDLYSSSVMVDTNLRQVTVDTGSGIYLSGYAAADIKDAQEKDPDITFLSKWLTDRCEPTESELFSANRAAKYYWINRKLFLRDWITEQGTVRLLLVPRSLKTEVMVLNHDIPAAGHQGIDRTRARIRSKYFWYRLTPDVESYVKTCGICTVVKTRNHRDRQGFP